MTSLYLTSSCSYYVFDLTASSHAKMLPSSGENLNQAGSHGSIFMWQTHYIPPFPTTHADDLKKTYLYDISGLGYILIF